MNPAVSTEHLMDLRDHYAELAAEHRRRAAEADDTNSQYAAAERGKAIGYAAAAAKLASVVHGKATLRGTP